MKKEFNWKLEETISPNSMEWRKEHSKKMKKIVKKYKRDKRGRFIKPLTLE